MPNELLKWHIDDRHAKILQKTRNTAYAYEGIISAYELVYLTKDTKAQNIFRMLLRQDFKLTSW